ncbi:MULTISPECIES: phosphatidylserine decarboxylase [Mycobacterium]|uniref:Phosphatidylserine decarboxylase n=2 Tax=Mycobacterium avium complex (MAC) TaxID=120793 RepID=A0ABM7K2G5_9MYCO|nr:MULTISPECIES: phosphatidylserine decarboxylase [Mycobacterium]AFC55208.1 phosphatidylserine decarboxylase-related protein [Mycobacterium paraintracellulare]AFS15642.1 Phosphatidyl serine decarboxylase proenzyme [Mycobacterium intracellulare subsp. intracellulare MTCC 9506]OSC30894.1 phosphatidylserine decarboxylase [Mycobacterium paraintracellulare]WRU81002.1 phosphatidylserine decarboxylase [Mycobacterium sp. 5-140-3-2]WSE42846.1 phosphatidylserine decarboxylase [Mycobacterium sp. 5-140-3-
MSEPDSVIHNLRDTLNNEPGLADRLERSLQKARGRAESELNPELYEALEWPRDIGEYEAYLKRFLRWVPHESDADAWKNEKRQAQEVSDRMAHFYFLVDQGDEPAQGSGVFREWLTDFARQWGNFLDTPESFSPEALQSFIDNAPEYRIHESLVDGVPNAPSGWLTANQFIAREINGGLRPIAEPTTNLVVTSPADCKYQHAYDIAADSSIPATTVKNEKYGNIKQLIEGSQYSESFARGTFVHYMLPVHAYHRYHLPVAGLVEESFRINGKVFMRVGLEEHEFASSDSASSGYEFSQTRGVVTVDTSQSDCGDIGIVAVIPVGMAHVSSVVLTAVPGKHMAKGEEFGYFQFGGSDIIILFQEGVDPQLDTSEEFRLVGSPVARCAAPRNPQ